MSPAGKKKVLGAGRKEERSRQGGSERVGDLAAQGEARGEAGAQVLLSPALRVRGTRGQRAEGPNLTGGAPKRCRIEDTCAGMRDLLEGLVRKGRCPVLRGSQPRGQKAAGMEGGGFGMVCAKRKAWRVALTLRVCSGWGWGFSAPLWNEHWHPCQDILDSQPSCHPLTVWTRPPLLFFPEPQFPHL